MVDRAPDYVILSGGGSIADLSGLDIEDPDKLVKDWLVKITRKEQDMAIKKDYKKMDRVKVASHTSRFSGEIGTVVAVSHWVFGDPDDICFLVDLDSGTSVTCDDQDLELWEGGAN